MRLLLLAGAAMLPAASAAAPAAEVANGVAQRVPQTAAVENCEKAEYHQANRNGPARFRKLDELPNATAFMAVYRTVDGCEVPLTVVEYRNSVGR